MALARLFPRHQKRGLIEALNHLGDLPFCLVFPRHQKRGLIEAGSSRAGAL